MKRILVFFIVILAFITIAACDSKNDDVILDVTPLETLSPTKAPAYTEPADSEVTAAPTENTEASTTGELPTPSIIPVRDVAKITNLPDYYYDFTVDGEELMYFTSYSNMYVDYDYAGIILRGTHTSSDPHIYLTSQYIRTKNINPTVYKYVAMRLKSNRTDMNFELRFGTASDDTINSYVTAPYKDTAEWQTIVFDLTKAQGTSSVTLDGSCLTRYRFDFFDGSKDIISGDKIILESMAFFKTLKEAENYEGLYK